MKKSLANLRLILSKKHFYIWFLIPVLVLIKIFFVNEDSANYLDSVELEWVGSEQCMAPRAFDFDVESEGLFLSTAPIPFSCRSQLFPLSANVLRLHYRYDVKTGGTSHPYRISLFSENGKEIQEFEVPNTSESLTGSWNELLLEVSREIEEDKSYYLEISSLKNKLPAIWVRDRVDILNKIPRESTEEIDHVVYSYGLEVIIPVFIFFASLSLGLKTSQFGFFAILFLAALGFHLSNSPFFYYDEWHVIQRFSEIPFPESVIYTHNEHFLPMFFTWFYSLLKIFGANYRVLLVVSCFLLALYSLVLKNLLVRLTFQEKTARVLAILFCVTSMHVEVMQWAFEQSILLCGIIGLGFLIQASEFLKTKSFGSLIGSVILIISAPLVFGGGFAYFPISIVLMTLLSLFMSQLSSLEKVKRISIFILVNAVAISAPLAMYLYFKNSSAGHAVNESSFFSNPRMFVAYCLQGIGLGSILRPVGVYPILLLTPPQEILNNTFTYIGLNFSEFRFSIYSFCVSLGVLFLLGFSAKSRIGGLKTSISIMIGSAIIVIFFFVFAAGRWHLGANQSLALRYQVQVLPGLCIILAPFIESLLFYISKNRKIQVGSIFVLALWVMIQCIAISSFSYFKYNGDKDRIYIHAAADSLDSNGNIRSGDIKSLPIHEPGITPGRKISDLNKTYYWLLGS